MTRVAPDVERLLRCGRPKSGIAYYQRNQQADRGSEWIWGVTQVPTVLSLLTPEYQKRMVQTAYHEAVTNAPQWSASFCWPEGFTRWWSQPSQAGNFQLTMTTWQVQFLSGIADNFLRQVMVGKQAHVQKTPQWYGETIGFWDGATLVTWTARIQAWQLSHVMFENSDPLLRNSSTGVLFRNPATRSSIS